MLVDRDEIIEARIELDGIARAGSVIDARLTDIGTKSRNAIALGVDGGEFLLPRGAPGISQGGSLRIEVTREAIPGAEPWKRPLARVADNATSPTPPKPTSIAFPSPGDPLSALGWSDLIDEARSGIVQFAGGELRISPTPAMTLIDVDGYLDPEALAVAGAGAAARAIRRLDLGGSIGIDLPTAASKAARQAAAAAIDAALPQPFERTAVNGFGFVQVVRPRRRASLIELAQDRAPFETRALLRRAAFATGAQRLVAHPAVTGLVETRRDWLDTLSRQVGGAIGLRTDASLPISAGYAERE